MMLIFEYIKAFFRMHQWEVVDEMVWKCSRCGEYQIHYHGASPFCFDEKGSPEGDPVD